MAKSGAPSMTAYNTPAQQEQCKCAASGAPSSPTTPGKPVGWQPINAGANMMQNYQQRVDAGYDPRREWHQQQAAQMGPTASFHPSWMTPGQQAGTQLSAPPAVARSYVGGLLADPARMQQAIAASDATINPGAQTMQRGGLLANWRAF